MMIAERPKDTPSVRLEAKALAEKMELTETAIMCAVWSDLLGNIDRVNRCLQQPGIDVGAVKQHYDAHL